MNPLIQMKTDEGKVVVYIYDDGLAMISHDATLQDLKDAVKMLAKKFVEVHQRLHVHNREKVLEAS
jgi:TATA-box binding protein (TBP) (component of TFIID and TFIIIB)